jgi:hypothetical protein
MYAHIIYIQLFFISLPFVTTDSVEVSQLPGSPGGGEGEGRK